MRKTLPPLLKNYQTSLESGDLEYAGYSIFMYVYHAYFAGVPLSLLEKEIAQYDQAGIRLKQENSLYWNRLLRQAVLNLRGAPGDPVPHRRAHVRLDEEHGVVRLLQGHVGVPHFLASERPHQGQWLQYAGRTPHLQLGHLWLEPAIFHLRCTARRHQGQ